MPEERSGVALPFNAQTRNEYWVCAESDPIAFDVEADVVVVPELQSAGALAPDW